MTISTEWHLSCPFRIDFYAGLRDFPHSRQNRLRRGVMSPQNGHIRCGANSARGFILSSFFTKVDMNSSKLRTREKI